MTESESSATAGRAWTIVGTFPTYEIAASKAAERRGSKGIEVKIKQLSTGFTVRTRRLEQDVSSTAQATQEASSASKKTKLKAKDRRARERSASSEDEFDSSSDQTT